MRAFRYSLDSTFSWVSRESRLELLNFWDSARSEVNTSRFMELMFDGGQYVCIGDIYHVLLLPRHWHEHSAYRPCF
jgi:hypothetical protein